MEDILKGDIVVSRELSPGSLIIRAVTWSKWSHVGVCLGDGTFISAVPFKGVIIKPLDTVKYKAFYRLKADLHKRHAIADFCLDRLKDKYDMALVALLAWRIFTDSLSTNTGDPAEHKYTCSELVAEACASQGIFFGAIVDNVLPVTIAKSDLVELIQPQQD